jgi:RimJ/RimL family protein N-acetyltransferase
MATDIHIAKARQLHKERFHQDAYDHLVTNLNREKFAHYIYENHPIWWAEISAGIVKLSRRSSFDSEFLKKLWGDEKFIYSFHRHANKLPSSQLELERLLEKEYLSLLSDSNSIHWIVKDKSGTPWGLLSLTSISLKHKRAEVLLGVLDSAPTGLSVAAMLILFQFFFRAIKFNKLTSFVYADNPHSLKGTLHLGFRNEGQLIKHSFDPESNQFIDMIQTGLLSEDAFTEKNKRLMDRLLT